jgi:glycosyltransferase involved in cell wall biosynthesis
MPPITALLHTSNSALRLGRALETLLPCAEILVVDHHSADATARVAREYGARILPAETRFTTNHYLNQARHDWILCLDSSESIAEGLQAALFEWSSFPAFSAEGTRSFSMFVREQVDGNWRTQPAPETRLIPRTWTAWNGLLPAYDPSSITLKGELLRFSHP